MPAINRSHATAFDVRESARTPAEAASFDDEKIPEPPARFVRALAAHAFEAVEGMRSIAGLGGAISVAAARQLALQRNLLRERRQVYRDRRQCVPSPGRMHLCRVQPDLAEASVVLHTEHRSYAVALRLEWVHGRWRGCEVYVM